MLDPNKTPFLFSVGTNLSYSVAHDFYDNVQYVWCSTHFDSVDQAPTSNPATIVKKYIDEAAKGDRHSPSIDGNQVGVMNGAKFKFKRKEISKEERRKIDNIVANAKFRDFLPVLFIIDTRKVLHKIEEVEVRDRASDESEEYRIHDLQANEYELIRFESLIDSLRKIPDRKVGEHIWRLRKK